RKEIFQSLSIIRQVLAKLPPFFFFQAEDGIRDWSVTGVQTCALPISAWPRVSWVVVRPAPVRPLLPSWPERYPGPGRSRSASVPPSLLAPTRSCDGRRGGHRTG